MARLAFWVVDTQHDLLRADGKLYIPHGEDIIQVLGQLTSYAHQKGIRVLASAVDHTPDHRELSDHPDFRNTFPHFCLHGTPGQAMIPETTLRNPMTIEPERNALAGSPAVTAYDGDLLFHKHGFDVFSNPHALPVLRALDPEVIVIYGVPTDISGRYLVEGLWRHRPHTRLYFVVDAARALRPDEAEHLLKEWAEEGVRLVSSVEILDDGILDKYLNA